MKPEKAKIARTWLTVEEIEKSWMNKPLYFDLDEPSDWLPTDIPVDGGRAVGRAILTSCQKLEVPNKDCGYLIYTMIGDNHELSVHFDSTVPWGGYEGHIFPNFWLAYAEVLRRAKHG